MDANILQYVTGPIQLIGLIILVLAALVPRLTHPRDAKNRHVLTWGLLGLGALGILGGIGLEAAKLHAPAAKPAPAQPGTQVNGNQVSGNQNAVGVGNNVGAPANTADAARSASVNGNVVTGNGNAVGIGNTTTTSPSPR